MFYTIMYQISFCNSIRDHNQQNVSSCSEKKKKFNLQSIDILEPYIIVSVVVLKAAMIYYSKHITTNWKHGLKYLLLDLSTDITWI